MEDEARVLELIRVDIDVDVEVEIEALVVDVLEVELLLEVLFVLGNGGSV